MTGAAPLTPHSRTARKRRSVWRLFTLLFMSIADYGYSEFLARTGLTEEAVWRMMNKLSEPVPNAETDAAFQKAASPIHGVGMFAMRDIKPGERFPVCCVTARYNLARYVNHSDEPNGILRFSDTGDGTMTVVLPIRAGEEVLMDYNDNMAKSLSISSFLANAGDEARRKNTKST